MSANTHPIFSEFKPVQSVGTGNHVFDFLGCRTNVKYKLGWEKHAVREGGIVMGKVPVANEHYFDWITVLEAVNKAQGTFRMAELGAGWAPWLVRSFAATKQCPSITKCEFAAVEADPTHLEWVREHFMENGLRPSAHKVLFGAVAPEKGVLKFPKIDDPTQDYGASLRAACGKIKTIDVPAYTIADIVEHFSGPIDLIHMDIQGSEYDSVPKFFDIFKSSIKAVMIGTHISTEMHDGLARLFQESNWVEVFNFPRNGEISTDYGQVKFGDGFLYFRNPRWP